MSWFIKKSRPLKSSEEKTVVVPEGLWEKCPSCNEIVYRKELEKNQRICVKCDYHFRLDPETRLNMIYDDGDYDLLYSEVISLDPLEFKGLKRYKDQLKNLSKRGKTQDGVWIAKGKIDSRIVISAVMDFSFLGGSMGSAVGEKLTRAVETAAEEGYPLIIFSCSGGARMMEGALSLMQMAKVSAALAILGEKRLPFISVLTDPTTGGVTASFAMLGDVNIAEPKALIGFAGPRVIQQTINQDLPEGFQRSEFLLEHGMLDAIVSRRELKKRLSHYIRFFSLEPVSVAN
jgi:acetyl-CoA carboxylase carboxyl transferase subunit beta